MSAVPDQDTVATLLTSATASPRASTRRKAEPASQLIDELREILQLERDQQRRETEALRDIADLEQRLIAAKVKLKDARHAPERSPSATTNTALTQTRQQVAAIVEHYGISSRDIRAWARQNDVDCPVTGALPLRVAQAYDQAHGGHGGAAA